MTGCYPIIVARGKSPDQCVPVYLRHSYAPEQLRGVGHASTAITADIYQHDELKPEDGVLAFDGSGKN